MRQLSTTMVSVWIRTAPWRPGQSVDQVRVFPGQLNAETFRTPQRGDREGSREQHIKSLETRMNLGLLANVGKEK